MDKDKRPSRWDLNRIIKEQKADIAKLEKQVMELLEELAKYKK